jgi:sortase A
MRERLPESRRIRCMLHGLEIALFTFGGVLAVWWAVVVVRANYYHRMPIPTPKAAASLPGEAPASTPVRAVRERGAWLARLEAPTVHLSATILEGSDDKTLARAAGHIEETSSPGETGNIGIAGHRDTIFRPLQHIRVGDPVTLATSDRVFRYRVSETRVVRPEDVYVLNPTEHPAMTLVTCYPFQFIGHAPNRFIVRAELIGEYAPESSARFPN